MKPRRRLTVQRPYMAWALPLVGAIIFGIFEFLGVHPPGGIVTLFLLAWLVTVLLAGLKFED